LRRTPLWTPWFKYSYHVETNPKNDKSFKYKFRIGIKKSKTFITKEKNKPKTKSNKIEKFSCKNSFKLVGNIHAKKAFKFKKHKQSNHQKIFKKKVTIDWKIKNKKIKKLSENKKFLNISIKRSRLKELKKTLLKKTNKRKRFLINLKKRKK
jgi:hypothetical protein